MILISPDPWRRETFAHGNARSLLMILSGCVWTEIIINFSLYARRLAELREDHAIFIRAPPKLTQHEAASGDDLWCEFQLSACRHEEGEKANTLTRVWKRNMKNKTEKKTTKRNARVLISLDNSTRRVGCVKKLSIFEGEEEKIISKISSYKQSIVCWCVRPRQHRAQIGATLSFFETSYFTFEIRVEWNEWLFFILSQ